MPHLSTKSNEIQVIPILSFFLHLPRRRHSSRWHLTHIDTMYIASALCGPNVGAGGFSIGDLVPSLLKRILIYISPKTLWYRSILNYRNTHILLCYTCTEMFCCTFVYSFDNVVFNTRVNYKKFSLSVYKVHCIVSITDVMFLYVAAKYIFMCVFALTSYY